MSDEHETPPHSGDEHGNFEGGYGDYVDTDTEPSPEELAALEAAFESEFGAALGAAHEQAAQAMEPAKIDVLARVRESLDDDSLGARRRDRRRHLRILFYVVNLVAVVLICVIYVMTRATIRLRETGERVVATQTEVVALSRALVRYLAADKTTPIPQDIPQLIKTIGETPERPGGYPFIKHRRRGETYLDDFAQPYLILVERQRVLVYSAGPNGRDEKGQGDDITDQWVTFVR
jgi:hypothetical protein